MISAPAPLIESYFAGFFAVLGFFQHNYGLVLFFLSEKKKIYTEKSKIRDWGLSGKAFGESAWRGGCLAMASGEPLKRKILKAERNSDCLENISQLDK